MNTSRLLPLVRRFSTATARNTRDANVEVHPGYLKFKETQKKFQIDNGLRIHERGGPIEKAIFNLTGILILMGGVVWVKNFITMAFPQKG
jgi:hypothetical protein